MSDNSPARRDRSRAFVPALIPEPVDLDRTGPLDPREERDLARVHEARDHHGTARWMRGKALEAAFRRRLYRGKSGTRTRQEYLDDEWDGISESAAYREIQEWRLAAQIAEVYGRPVADSHVRALADVAGQHGHEAVAGYYAQLRQHGASTGQRVTAAVVERLAEYLSGRLLEGPAEEQQDLAELFARQLPAPRQGRTARGKAAAEAAVKPTAVIPKFGNDWVMTRDQVARLSTWIAAEAARSGLEPDQAADLLVDALTSDTAPLRPWADRTRT